MRSTEAKKPLVSNKIITKIGYWFQEGGCELSLQRPSYKIERNSMQMTKLKKYFQKFQKTISFEHLTKNRLISTNCSGFQLCLIILKPNHRTTKTSNTVKLETSQLVYRGHSDEAIISIIP